MWSDFREIISVKRRQKREKAGNHNNFLSLKKKTSLVMEWLRLYASTAWGAGSIPAGGTFHKIPQAAMYSLKKKKF